MRTEIRFRAFAATVAGFAFLLPCFAQTANTGKGVPHTFTRIDDLPGVRLSLAKGLFSPDGTRVGYDVANVFHVYDIASRGIVSSATPDFNTSGGFTQFDGARFTGESGTTPPVQVFDAVTGFSVFVRGPEDFGGGTAKVVRIEPVVAPNRVGYEVEDIGSETDGVYINDQRILDPGIMDPAAFDGVTTSPSSDRYEHFTTGFFTDEGIAYVVSFHPSPNTGRVLYTADLSGGNRRRIHNIHARVDGVLYSRFESVRLSGADNVAYEMSNGFGQAAIYASLSGATRAVALKGDPMPESDGDVFNTFSQYAIDGTRVLLQARGAAGARGVYLWSDGTLYKVLAKGDLLEGEEVTDVSLGRQSMARGQILLNARLQTAGRNDYLLDADEIVDTTPGVEGDPDLTLQINTLPHGFDAPQDLICGGPGVFRIVVINQGEGPTTGPITVIDELPPGLAFLSGEGNGWICTAVGQTVTCVREEPLDYESSNTSSEVRIKVRVSEEALPSVQNAATVSTPDEAVTSNNSNFVVASVAEALTRVEILAPTENDRFPTGSSPRLSVSVFAAGYAQGLNLNLFNISYGWDAGPQYEGGEGVPASYSQSLITERIPADLSEGASIEYTVTGTVVHDNEFYFSKPATRRVAVTKVPNPPFIRIRKPTEEQVVAGSDVSGLSMVGFVEIVVDRGLRTVPKVELTGDFTQEDALTYRLVPYILERNSDGLITAMNMFVSVTLPGADFDSLFPVTRNDVSLSVSAQDIEGDVTDESVDFVVMNEDGLKPAALLTEEGKGTNTVDAASSILDSAVSGSTLEKSLIVDSTVTNSIVRSSVLLPGTIASDAEIDFGVVLSGIVSRDGVTLVPPALLANLYDPGELGHVLSTVFTGDANGDGVSSALDRLGLANEWQRESEAFDLNLSNKVDARDLLELRTYWKVLEAAPAN